MGIDAEALIPGHFRLEEVETLLRAASKSAGDLEPALVEGRKLPLFFRFICAQGEISVHPHTWTPFGTATALMGRPHEQIAPILQRITETVGGLWQADDTTCNYTYETGKLCPEDGLAYHLRYAVVHESIDRDSIRALNASMHKWNVEVNGHISDDLFPER